jgi:AraC-like DNA-binding protein
VVSFLAGIVLGVTSSVISQAIDNQIEYPNPINSPLLGSLIYLTFAGVIFAALIGLFAVIRKKERAILVYAIIPPGIPHIMYCRENQSAETILMDFTFDAVFNGRGDEEIENSIDYYCLKDFLFPPETLQPKMSVSERNRRQIEMLLDHITQLQVNEIDDIQSDFLARMNLLTLLASLVVDSHSQEHDRRLKPGQDDQDLLKPGLDLIRSDFAGSITCEDAARTCNLSPSYFRHLLKECTGKTFTTLLTELRVNCALDLLEKTSKSIMEISLDCGFSDMSSLYRAFKKSVGLSPLIYRSLKRETKQNLHYSEQNIH